MLPQTLNKMKCSSLLYGEMRERSVKKFGDNQQTIMDNLVKIHLERIGPDKGGYWEIKR
jgi:hypothetical protein